MMRINKWWRSGVMNISHNIARDLLTIGAVQINTTDYFTWTSGLKSPIYCDNRLTMSYPTIRKSIAMAFKEKLNDLKLKPDVIAGCATAGIPHAAWLADIMDLPMVYVRSSPKGHGKGNQIEGQFKAGQKVVVIEDLISTGGSSIDAAQALQNEGADVLGVYAIFTYGLKKADDNFKAINLDYTTLTTFDDLIQVYGEEESLTTSEKSTLITWRDSLK